MCIRRGLSDVAGSFIFRRINYFHELHVAEVRVSPVVCFFCLRLKHVSGSYRSDKSGVRKGSVNTFNSSQLNSLLSFA
jgi:hypothetical protein